MKLKVGNVHTLVESDDPDERRWLKDLLTLPGDYWDDGAPTCVYRQGRIPSGIAVHVWSEARKIGRPVEVVDARTPPATADATADLSWLRDYQVPPVERAVKRRRGVLWLPTGAGKTEVAIAITRVLPCRWLFLVHTATLLHQTKERFDRRAIESGLMDGEDEAAARLGAEGWRAQLWGDGHQPHELGRFTVAMFQSVHRALDSAAEDGPQIGRTLLDQVEGVIVDECHTVAAASHYAVLQSMPNAYFRIGLSGTPFARGDGRSLLVEAAIGPTIHRVRTQTLVDAGVLAKPVIRMVQVHQRVSWEGPITHRRAAGRAYRRFYEHTVSGSGMRNAAVVEVVRACAKPALVFVKDLEHGETLRKAIARAGISVEFCRGSDSTSSRQRTLKLLERGEIDVVVTTRIFQEGVDVPDLRSVVHAAGGRSAIQAIQQGGRALRVAEGKTTCEIWDFDDRGHRWLARHTRDRRKAYEAEGFAVISTNRVDARPGAGVG